MSDTKAADTLTSSVSDNRLSQGHDGLEEHEEDSTRVKWRIYKNLWVNIAAYFILYSAFIGLAVIQVRNKFF